MFGFINEKRKPILRKKILEDIKKINPQKVLDNGSGKKGSWDYLQTPLPKIIQSDKIFGDNSLNLKFKNKSFDCVVFTGVLQYLSDPVKAIRECNRVLGKNGMLIISAINAMSLVNSISGFKAETAVFTMQGFRIMLETAGFKILREEFIDFPIIPKSRKMILYLVCKKIK